MLRDGFLRFCNDPEIACCKAERELEQLRTENASLREQLAEAQRREKAAVEDMNEAQGCVCLICKWYQHLPVKSCAKFPREDFEGALMCGQFEWRGPVNE